MKGAYVHPGNGVKLAISLQMPSSEPQKKYEECKRPPVEDRIRQALENILSDRDSHEDWILINKIYKSLCSMKKLSSRGRNIKNMIEPVLAKFGYYKTSSNNSTK